MKATVPDGVPDPVPATVTLKEIALPNPEDAADDLTVVVVAIKTVWFSVFEALPAKSASPL
jgi:hypothetical protein